MTLLRILLPLIGTVIFVLMAKLLTPPKNVVYLALKICWIVGLLNLLADVLGSHYGFWRYTMTNLFLGFPLDIYVTVSLVYGGALMLIYWRLRTYHRRWVPFLVVALPFYGLLRDYSGQKMTGDAFLVWTNRYWWIADFFAYAVTLWSVLFTFDKLLNKQLNSSSAVLKAKTHSG